MKILSPVFDPSSRWFYPLRAAILILTGLAIYAQTFGFYFIFDDLNFVVNNPFIKNFAHVTGIWSAYPPTRTLGFYSFAFNYYFNQLHPQGYHIFNFAVHLLNVGIVWALAALIFRMAGKMDPEPPFVAALLFLVHPCQTQAVSYISQRFESIAAFFYFGSIYTYILGRRASSPGKRILLFSGTILLAILGICTKEVAVTIPFTVLAVEFIFFKHKEGEDGPGFKTRLFLISAGGVLFFLLFARLVRSNLNHFIHFEPIPSHSHDGDWITLNKYLLTQMRVFLTFIRILFLPFRQNMDYDYPLSSGLLSPPLTLAGSCAFIASIIAVFKLYKKYPVMAFGIAWVLLTFSINLVPRSDVIFEHKLYLISFGFFLFFVEVLFTAIRRRHILARVVILTALALSLVSLHRNQVWRDDLTLWDDVVQKSPQKARAYYGRGFAYFHRGDFSRALPDFNKALQINPDYTEVYINRSFIDEKQGDLKQAVIDLSKIISLTHPVASTYNDRGDMYGRMGFFDLAMTDFNEALKIDPKFVEAYVNRGVMFAQKADYIQALFDFDRAVELKPGFAGGYSNRAVVYYQLKEYDKAWADVQTTRSLGGHINPGFLDDLTKSSSMR